MNNYLMLRKSIFRYKEYVFIDIIDHLYEKIMQDAKVKLINVRESIKVGTPYRLIFCMVFGVAEEDFLRVVRTIRSKALLLGYKDYDKYCDQLSILRDNIGV